MSYPAGYRIEREHPRRRRNGETARLKAIQTAIELFAVGGYGGTSIADVAAKTGLSQSGLLHHFPSKTVLLSAVLEHRSKEDADFLFDGEQAPLGWEAFDALVSLVARNSTRPDWVGLFVRLSAEATEPGHPAHQWLLDHYSSLRRWLSEALEDGKVHGNVSQDAPVEAIVNNTIAVLDGIQQQWLCAPGSFSMVAQLRIFIESIKTTWG
ncbi:TetR/AcrR family transcriptional regulator [Arthrobacter sp. CDRTa11]|uniref:TetR/AcrR family transcriptional regulator n=1 Tax=Arthrobacter sp. CDRTa11 TaxID=2651199 RepID=UPI002265AC14|nr:TetR/AcrR family transcriptional regulator [Arthrobacter sp. CDRTa11]UZX02829.1 TetR/AcrR family transcriptional regulator [Arthrobacter sp. CDRTa11]